MVYKENGWIARVEIVEDKSDDKYERYTLRHVELIQPNGLPTPAIGDTFEVSALKSGGYSSLWHLYDDDEAVIYNAR